MRAAHLYAAAAGAVFTALSVGCGRNFSYDDTAFLCPDGQSCPVSYTCVAGRCELPGSGPLAPGTADASPSADPADDRVDAAPDAAPPAAGCDPAVLPRDDFDDGVLDPIWAERYASGDADIAEVNGKAEIRVGAGGEAALVTTCRYDLNSGAITVEVEPGGANAYLHLNRSATELIAVSTGGNSLRFELIAPNASQTRAAPYDLAAHRWWRVSTRSGEFLLETSRDGMTWTRMNTLTAAFASDALQLSLGADSRNGRTGTARFDNLR